MEVGTETYETARVTLPAYLRHVSEIKRKCNALVYGDLTRPKQKVR